MNAFSDADASCGCETDDFSLKYAGYGLAKTLSLGVGVLRFALFSHIPASM